MMFFLGIFNAYPVTSAYYILPFGYSGADASIMGVGACVAGMVGSFVGGVYVRKTGNYKAIIIAGIACTLIWMVITYISLY